MKFYKSKKTKGIYTARDYNDTPQYVFGTIEDLINADLLIPDYAYDQNDNYMKAYIKTHWICIDRLGHVQEFGSMEEIKATLIELEEYELELVEE